jgi:hypothetical protein
MLPFEDRFSRQRRLPEVGALGQDRLAGARVHVHPEADIEAEYLARAGLGVERDGDPPGAFAHAAAFRFDAARGVAAGAWRALARIRAVLELA